MLIYLGQERTHQRGAVMLLSERAKKALIGYDLVSDRILTARFKGVGLRTTI